MSNYKRVRRFAGKPPLLEPIEREYETIWLQPINEQKVPTQVRVYEKEDGWYGHRVKDTSELELYWMRGLWKKVPSPLGEEALLTPVSDDDEETTEEISP